MEYEDAIRNSINHDVPGLVTANGSVNGQVVGLLPAFDAFNLSWPLSAQNFSVQTTTNLADPNSWVSVTAVPAVVNSQNFVTNAISTGSRFYRLKQ